jgi:excisionase family DNA binding protein
MPVTLAQPEPPRPRKSARRRWTDRDRLVGSDWLSVEDCARELDCGTRPIYKAIRAGTLRSFPIGRKFRIHKTWLAAWTGLV